MHLGGVRCWLQACGVSVVWCFWLFSFNAAGAEAGGWGRVAGGREVEVGVLGAATRKRGPGCPGSACWEKGRVGAGRRGGGSGGGGGYAAASEVGGGGSGELAAALSQEWKTFEGEAAAVGAGGRRRRRGRCCCWCWCWCWGLFYGFEVKSWLEFGADVSGLAGGGGSRGREVGGGDGQRQKWSRQAHCR